MTQIGRLTLFRPRNRPAKQRKRSARKASNGPHMKLFWLSLALTCAGTTAQHGRLRLNPSKAEVCIVGAGPSGLAAARRLEQRGYERVTIFERNAGPGGRVQKWLAPDGDELLITALEGVTGAFNEVEALLSDHSLGTNPMMPATYVYEYESGEIRRVIDLGLNRTATLEAANRYIELRNRYAAYLVPGFINGMPKELIVPMDQWIISNGLQDVFPAFYFASALGTGSLSTLPAMYGLLYTDGPQLLYRLGFNTAFTADFHELYQRMARGMRAQIRYNTRVMNAIRCYAGGVTLQFDKPGFPCQPPTEYHCDALILAFPPTAASLAGFQLDPEEYEVFSRSRHNSYFSSVVKLRDASFVSKYINMLQPTGGNPPYALGPIRGNGQPAWFYRPNGDLGDNAVVFGWKEGAPITPARIRDNIVRTMSLLNRDPSQPPDMCNPIREEDVVGLWEWEYFSHFGMDSMNPSIFDALEALQGRRRTFWATPLRCYDNLEQVTRSAYDIVDRYF